MLDFSTGKNMIICDKCAKVANKLLYKYRHMAWVMALEALRSLKPILSALEKRIKELEDENCETHARMWILQERLKEEISKNTTLAPT